MDDDVKILAIAASVLMSLLSLCLSFIVFKRQMRHRRFELLRNLNADFQKFNQIIIDDDDFIAIESKTHPYGDLSKEQTKKMYYYFMRLNLASLAFYGEKDGHMPKNEAEAILNNEIFLMMKDRDFIEKHVFVRGYNKRFIRYIVRRWKKLETNQVSYRQISTSFITKTLKSISVGVKFNKFRREI